MRILIVTLGTLIVFFMGLLTVKFWGQSQIYADYQHPLFAAQSAQNLPLVFYKYSPEKVEAALDSSENLFLDVASTVDNHMVVATTVWTAKDKPIRYATAAELKGRAIELTEIKQKLATKKLIFNLSENAQGGHVIFFEELKKLGLEKGENFIVTTPYEAIAKALKEMAPTLVYGSTQPEILKLVAMRSMWVIEAVNLRADVIIQPLQIRHQKFYDEALLRELARRHKRFIVGPIIESERAEAENLHPFGLIIER